MTPERSERIHATRRASDRRRRVRGSIGLSARVLAVLVILMPAFWLAVMWTPRGEAVHALVCRWCRRALRWSGCEVRTDGLEHIDPQASVLLVANHSSFLDSIVLFATVPGSFRFVANHLVATRPFIGLAVRKAGHIIVNRDSASSRAACARAMIACLRAGTSLLVFPEGTRGDGALLPFRLGPFRVAASAERAVVPIAIRGTREILPRRLRLLARAPISVTILPPIGVDSARPASVLRDKAAEAIARALARS